MTMKSYRTEVNVRMKLSMEGFCEGVGVLCEGEAKQLCPTGVTEGDHTAGTLKRAITHEAFDDFSGVAIGILEDTEASEYALAVEKGINQPSQPYLEPGVVNSIPRIINVARKNYAHEFGGE